ncbi:hypothetical protein INR49_003872 [Caranx melampygus]|nr:hypothetical protein INR49_003872 [Caranx melampygus]
MLLFLLVPALALLVSPAAVGCSHHNLRRIIELVGKYNESLSKEFFVEDVQPLYEADTSCEELLKDVQPTGIEIQIPKVIELLSKCIKQRNWNGNKR